MTSEELTKEDLKNIYTLYLCKNMSRHEISVKFKISESIISNIIKAGSYAGLYQK